MATTPEQIAAKHGEFQEAITALVSATTDYQAAITPYVEKRQALTDAIARVGVLDDELEALIADFEPPAIPQPQ